MAHMLQSGFFLVPLKFEDSARLPLVTSANRGARVCVSDAVHVRLTGLIRTPSMVARDRPSHLSLFCLPYFFFPLISFFHHFTKRSSLTRRFPAHRPYPTPVYDRKGSTISSLPVLFALHFYRSSRSFSIFHQKKLPRSPISQIFYPFRNCVRFFGLRPSASEFFHVYPRPTVAIPCLGAS